jgi:hypothetical protein
MRQGLLGHWETQGKQAQVQVPCAGCGDLSQRPLPDP